MRRNGVQLAIASARPSALDPNAKRDHALCAGRGSPVHSRAGRCDRGRGLDFGRRRQPGEVPARCGQGHRDPLGRAPAQRGASAPATDRGGRSASPSAPAPGCSSSPRARTVAACARRAPCRTRDLATRDPAADRPERRRRSPGRCFRRDPRALPVRDRPGSRPAEPRTVGRGPSPRWARGRARLGAHRGPARARERRSSRPSPTPRRRGRSYTQMVVCSACAPRSAILTRSAPAGGSWPTSASGSGSTPAF